MVLFQIFRECYSRCSMYMHPSRGVNSFIHYISGSLYHVNLGAVGFLYTHNAMLCKGSRPTLRENSKMEKSSNDSESHEKGGQNHCRTSNRRKHLTYKIKKLSKVETKHKTILTLYNIESM